MKRFLPLLLFLLGLVVLAGVYFLVLKKPSEDSEEEADLIEVSLNDRPFASLTPKSDGHWLKLKVEKIRIEAESLDYELLYSLPDGRTQGVPGTILLKGQTSIERDLLLGSESSGKFRYDEGVEDGTLTLRFRNSQGKLIAKFATKFHLESGVTKLTSVDGKFSFELSKASPKTFFVTMETFGILVDAPGNVVSGPYGIFASTVTSFPGSVKLPSGSVYMLDGGSWGKVEGGDASDIGIFVGISE